MNATRQSSDLEGWKGWLIRMGGLMGAGRGQTRKTSFSTIRY